MQTISHLAVEGVPSYEEHSFAKASNSYCVCVFVINENGRLHAQLERMRAYCEGVADIVIADGGSTDGSTEHDKLREMGVNTLLVKTGPGKLGSQMRMAFSWAMERGYQGVVVMDGNNKDGPEAVPDFVEALEQGVDHVQGSRFIPGGDHANTPASRYWGVRLLHAPMISLASGVRYTDTTNGFRAYSRRLLQSEDVAVFREIFPGYELHYYLAIRAAKLGLKVQEIPVSRRYPNKGKTPTKISPFRGNFGVLQCLAAACLGQYDPQERG